MYVKIPKLNFPIQANGKAPLVQDLSYYDKNALYNEILAWRRNKIPSDGIFKNQGRLRPKMDSTFASLDIYGMKIKNSDTFFKPYTDGGVLVTNGRTRRIKKEHSLNILKAMEK